MIRLIVWLIALIVGVTFLRGVIGIFGKAIGNHVGRQRVPRPPQPDGVQEPLRKCAQCGDYAAVYATSQRGGAERHYCSPDCQERAEAARR